MNCEQKPKNLGNYSSTHLGPAAATRDLERCFVLRIPVHGPLMNPIFGITLINCKRPWWTMMTHAQTHTQTLHNHVFGFLSYILSYFVIWKMVFCVFGGIWGHLRHVANFLADACWGHASTTVTREGKSQRHRWHVGFQHVYTMFVHTMCVLYMYYILYGQLFKRIGNYTLTYSEVYWTWSLNMIIQHDF